MYNEEKVIGTYLENLSYFLKSSGEKYEVVILDDGSTDKSYDIVKNFTGLNVNLLKHDKNQGVGAAVRHLFAYVCEKANPDDIIFTMDSDNTHDPKYIDIMIKKIREGYDLVIASRYADEGGEVGFSAFRSLLSKGTRLTMQLFFPIKNVRDYSCGYRAYKADIIKKTIEKFGENTFTTNGFTCYVEFLIKANMTNGLKVAEVPLVLRYDLKKSASKLKVFKTIREYIMLIYKLKFR